MSLDSTTRGFIARRWKTGLRLAFAMVALWLLVCLLVAWRLTRRPHPRYAEPAPSLAWGMLDPQRLKTRDGESIGAWFIAGTKDNAPSVLLLHGNGGGRTQLLGQAKIYAEEGCSVLLITLRGHGDSSGEFNDIGLSARFDVFAAVDFLERRRPRKPILIHGASLGAAAATFASEELARRISGYLLECPYRDLKTAVRHRTENALPPPLDLIAYLGLVTVSPLFLPDLDRIAPIEAVAGIPQNVPIVILAGGKDRRARPWEARAIYDRVKSHARLVIFEDADHLEPMARDPERYRREVIGFVRGVQLQERELIPHP